MPCFGRADSRSDCRYVYIVDIQPKRLSLRVLIELVLILFVLVGFIHGEAAEFVRDFQ